MSLPFEALFQSCFLVAISEMGDKTQILALILAARYKKPWPIIAGIVLSTLFNHLLAGWLGQFLGQLPIGPWLGWLINLSFVALGIWIWMPDKVDEDEAPKQDWGPFLTTSVAFFLAEMGDKTQVATVALAAHYHTIFMVILGSTLGLLIANVPVVLFGDKILKYIPMDWVRRISSLLFLAFGLWGIITLLKPDLFL